MFKMNKWFLYAKENDSYKISLIRKFGSYKARNFSRKELNRALFILWAQYWNYYIARLAGATSKEEVIEIKDEWLYSLRVRNVKQDVLDAAEESADYAIENWVQVDDYC